MSDDRTPWWQKGGPPIDAEDDNPIGFDVVDGQLCGMYLVPSEQITNLQDAEISQKPSFCARDMDKWDSAEFRDWLGASRELDAAIFSCLRPTDGKQD